VKKNLHVPFSAFAFCKGFFVFCWLGANIARQVANPDWCSYCVTENLSLPTHPQKMERLNGFEKIKSIYLAKSIFKFFIW